MELEFHLREAELDLEARGGSRAKRFLSIAFKNEIFLLFSRGMNSVTTQQELPCRSTTMGGLLHPSWNSNEGTEVGGSVDDFTEDGNEEEEEEEEEEEIGEGSRKEEEGANESPRMVSSAIVAEVIM